MTFAFPRLKRFERRLQGQRVESMETPRGTPRLVRSQGDLAVDTHSFDAGLHPALRFGDLSDSDRRRLVQSILQVARQACRTGGVTNSASRVKELKAEGVRRREY